MYTSGAGLWCPPFSLGSLIKANMDLTLVILRSLASVFENLKTQNLNIKGVRTYLVLSSADYHHATQKTLL
jgi:hypothetical protein